MSTSEGESAYPTPSNRGDSDDDSSEDSALARRRATIQADLAAANLTL